MISQFALDSLLLWIEDALIGLQYAAILGRMKRVGRLPMATSDVALVWLQIRNGYEDVRSFRDFVNDMDSSRETRLEQFRSYLELTSIGVGELGPAMESHVESVQHALLLFCSWSLSGRRVVRIPEYYLSHVRNVQLPATLDQLEMPAINKNACVAYCLPALSNRQRSQIVFVLHNSDPWLPLNFAFITSGYEDKVEEYQPFLRAEEVMATMFGQRSGEGKPMAVEKIIDLAKRPCRIVRYGSSGPLDRVPTEQLINVGEDDSAKDFRTVLQILHSLKGKTLVRDQNIPTIPPKVDISPVVRIAHILAPG